MFKEVPAQFDFPAAEREILRFWAEDHIFEKSLQQREGAPIFVFYEGPPTANGLPHPGHCLTRTIKDVWPRYKTMTGHYCPRKGGWDTHGLPVETEVCKGLGIHTKQEIEAYGVEKFIQLCQQSVFRYMQEWEELTRRLGFWMDLKEAYVTYHQSYVESIWWALKTFFDRGLLFQGHKIVWWWPQGGTALSAGEVGQGYKEVDDPSVFVRFPVARESLDLFSKRIGYDATDMKVRFLAWTTTPWTLPSNCALAVHPDTDYVLISPNQNSDVSVPSLIAGEELLVVAPSRMPAIFGGKDKFVLQAFKGRDLTGIKYEPLFNYAKPTEGKLHEVVTADFVTLDTGTGIVHIAPAFGEDDYRLAQEKGLAFIQLVAPDGKFVPEVTDFAGIFCKTADPEIIRNLKDRGLLLKREQYRHEYPFCWRAEEDPLIQYARKSWFIRTTDFREEFLKNNERINWLPEHIKGGRFGNFLEANVDWALSRERFWGTPLPIWECEKTGRQEAISSYAELLTKPGVQGTEVWDNAKKANPALPDDLRVHKPYIDAVTYASPFAPGARMRRVSEVIDVWFDSGCMPFAQWGYPHKPGSAEMFRPRLPADFISEAIDQTRGWFYTLLSISTMLFGAKSTDVGGGTFTKDYPHPFRNCIVLGLMSGEDGKKLSKSKRNYKEPTYIFDREGADAMRWSMLSGQAPWTGVRFNEDTIATDQREFLIKLYNVYSFFTIYANIDQWTPTAANATACTPSELDRWMMAELQQTIVDVRAAMDRYENYPACRRLVEFVDGLSNWYVRRSRDRFWRSGADADKSAAYLTLWRCLTTTAELIAPFTPFIAETLYQNLVRGQVPGVEESVHLRQYPEADAAAIDRRLIEEMAVVREIASLGRAARMEAKMKVRQPLPVVELVLANPDHRAWLEGHLPLIAEELNVRSVEFAADADRYVSYEVKPNFKVIGPKFGKLAPRLKAVLPTLNAADLRRQLDAVGKAAITIDGQAIELTPEDVQVTLKAKEGWAAAQGRAVVVVLSTALTPELKAEGMANDFVHLVQTARKEEKLDYQDRIRLTVATADPVAAAITAFKDSIQAETLATELTMGDVPAEGTHEGEIEGTPVSFKLEVQQ